MGQCIKCGRETPHEYTYWSGDALDSKTCVNVQKHTAYLCTRCAMRSHVIYLFIVSAAHAIYAAINIYRDIRTVVIHSGHGPRITPHYGMIAFYGIVMAAFFALSLHILRIGRRDKAPPSYAGTGTAEKCIVNIMRRQHPGINYFVPSDYH